MGSDPDSPLDERLRVRGVDNLRVADASAFPEIPRANTNAPSIMIGERCADFLLAERAAAPFAERGLPPRVSAVRRARSPYSAP
jgi:choline dehydrogenase